MNRLFRLARAWGPALFLMATIFFFSSRTSGQLPGFGPLDYLVKKLGHVVGYALLALTYWRGLPQHRSRMVFAWGLALMYAATDEFHQLFVAGRHPSVFDVLVFDNLGAILGLGLGWRLRLGDQCGGTTRTPGPAPRLHPRPQDDRSEYR